MKSFRCRRWLIQRVLEIFSIIGTDIPEWNISISQENLHMYPEDGNLLEYAKRVVNDTDVEDVPIMKPDHEVLGPAPLQNIDDPTEQYFSCVQTKTDLKDSECKLATEILEQFAAKVEGKEVHMKQENVFKLGKFADMTKTKLAWALAFPTLFPPIYDIKSKKWVIRGDYTSISIDCVSEKDVSFSEWSEWVMWSSNGFHVEHPTFALVLNSEITRTGLFKQGKVTLSKNDIPGNTTVQSFQENWGTEQGREKFKKSLNYHVGNVRGTDQYWSARNREFRSFAHHMKYKKNMPMRLFVTSSLAEYHDPFLRRLLSKYISIIRSKNDGELLLTDDKVFHKAVQTCKNIVTHYFSFKQEVWMREVISPIYEIHHYTEAKEFAKGRGAIHSHGNAYGNGSTYIGLDYELAKIGLDAYEIFMKETENDSNTDAHLKEKIPVPDDIVLETISPEITNILKDASHAISDILRKQYGFTASHVGRPPEEWARPGGNVIDGHRGTHTNMISKSDILEKKVLQQFKFHHERNLHHRRVHITNHCFDHKCSLYCWKKKTMDVKYCQEKHGPRENNPDIKEIYNSVREKKHRKSTDICF